MAWASALLRTHGGIAQRIAEERASLHRGQETVRENEPEHRPREHGGRANPGAELPRPDQRASEVEQHVGDQESDVAETEGQDDEESIRQEAGGQIEFERLRREIEE